MKRLTGFFNMKKWVLGALACAALVLLMPGEAKANEVITTTVGADNTNIGNGCSWNVSTNTLTLNGATIEVSERNGIYLNQAATINLVGDNAITVTGSGNGIVVYGDLTIKGDGTLTIKTGKSDGIWAEGSITIKDTNVTISCGNDGGDGLNGLYPSNGDTIIDNSELEITINDSYPSHCIDSNTRSRSLTVERSSNLKVIYKQRNGQNDTIIGKIDGKEDKLCGLDTYYIKITYKDSTNPGTTPSDNKSDDKKNESSPFHKFETGSIKEAKASGTIDATGGWKSFDRGTLNELSKLGKDISVTYDFNGHTYCVVVPKGFDPQNLVNEEGYCGFLYLAKVYGAVMIK